MFLHKYKIADISFAVETSFPYALSRKFDHFRTDRIPEKIFEFIQLDEKPDYQADPIVTPNFIVYDQKDALYQERRSGASCVFSCAVHAKEEKIRHKILLYPEAKERNLFRQDDEILEAMDFPWLLNRMGALFLHASFIAWKGKGILFTAPSQTGKSTQASLWECYENARVINGDRAILRKKAQVWHAYGSPYAGSSEVFLNENYPIRAISVLRQKKENTIRKLSPREAFIWLYSELISRPWDKYYNERELQMIEDLVLSVPVYFLECRPDRGAVELLKYQILQEEQGCLQK